MPLQFGIDIVLKNETAFIFGKTVIERYLAGTKVVGKDE